MEVITIKPINLDIKYDIIRIASIPPNTNNQFFKCGGPLYHESYKQFLEFEKLYN